MHKLIRYSAILTLMCFNTGLTFAGDRQREENVSFGFAKLQEINLEHAKFRRIRDDKILGPNALKTSYSSYDDASLAWLGNWYKILERINFADKLGPADLANFASGVEADLKAQTEEFYKLKEKSLALQIQLTEANRLVASTNPPASAAFPESYRELVDRLKADIETAQKGIKQLDDNLAMRQAKFELAGQTIRNRLQDGLREKLIATGSNILIEALQKALQIFEADRLITAENEAARVAYNQFSRLSSFYFYYQSQSQGSELKAKIGEAIVRIQSADIPSEWKAVGIENLKRYTDKIDSQVNFISSRDPRVLLVQSHKRLVFAFKKKCDNKDTLVNCSLVQTLARLSDAQLSAFTEQKQRDLEALWLTVGAL